MSKADNTDAIPKNNKCVRFQYAGTDRRMNMGNLLKPSLSLSGTERKQWTVDVFDLTILKNAVLPRFAFTAETAIIGDADESGGETYPCSNQKTEVM